LKILVINCGSSSVKCTLFTMPERQALATGLVEKIGEGGTAMTVEAGGESSAGPCAGETHAEALRLLLDAIRDRHVIESMDELSAVGHRVVHAGELTDSVVVDRKILDLVREQAIFAPLHNPPNLAGLEAALELLPDRPHVAVFDTAFHAGMPPEAFLYALPHELYRDHGVRAYGFHGTSYRYVTGRAAELLGIPQERLNLIALHLGNGCSAAAIRNGRSVDTSMGLTPLQGLVMGTRSGDVDPGLFFFLIQRLGIGADEVYAILNEQSGLLGLSGLSKDVRDVLKAASEGNESAELALSVFAYRVKKYVGAYLAVLGGAHALVFTAGIGENSPEVRRRACEGLEGLGVILDDAKNQAAVGEEAVISAEDSPVAVLVVPTDEALEIAMETYDLLREASR